MKSVILAGGFGNRLFPLTKMYNKHLLPIYNKPMIFYPLKTLASAGIKDILIVTGPVGSQDFRRFLGNGKDFGVKISYALQKKALGIANALSLAKNFAGKQNIAVILGDNIYGNTFDFSSFKSGAKIFLKKVRNPNRFGVPVFDNKKLVMIEEKPKKPKSEFAVTGLYLYDSKVFDYIKKLKPSKRGEYEISDVNNMYIEQGKLGYEVIRGFWSDAGTFESMHHAEEYVRKKGFF